MAEEGKPDGNIPACPNCRLKLPTDEHLLACTRRSRWVNVGLTTFLVAMAFVVGGMVHDRYGKAVVLYSEVGLLTASALWIVLAKVALKVPR